MSTAEIFANRLIKLRELKHITQEELAKALQVTRQSLSLYEKAERTINIDLLNRIAEYFNVSSDYLLGLSDITTSDKDLKAVCEYLGLSERAIENIKRIAKNKKNAYFLDLFLSERDLFYIMADFSTLSDKCMLLENLFIKCVGINSHQFQTDYGTNVSQINSARIMHMVEYCKSVLKFEEEKRTLSPLNKKIWEDAEDKYLSPLDKKIEEVLRNIDISSAIKSLDEAENARVYALFRLNTYFSALVDRVIYVDSCIKSKQGAEEK